LLGLTTQFHKEGFTMATVKRQRHNNTAGKPTISVAVERTAQSLAGERKVMLTRRMSVIGALGLSLALVAGLLLSFRPFAPAASSPTAPVATAAPVVQAPVAAQAEAALITQPTAAPAIQTNPTAVPAAIAAPQSSGAAAGSAIACDAIASLPLYSGAICVKHDLDQDDGVIKAENTYTTPAPADDVRRFFEGAFASNGWALNESSYDAEDVAWKYTVVQGQRRVKISVETKAGVNGVFTKIQIAEK
jgi:hypothetical protein